jgi:DNA-binding CsgD family transcriptional regulator
MPRPIMTKRRLEILRLTAIGYNTEEAASILGLSSHTVKHTLAQTRKILRVPNTTRAIIVCLKYGYLHLRDL